MTVSFILSKKGSDVLTANENTNLLELAVLLSDRKVGAAVVLGSNDSVKGIISERDIVTALAKNGPNAAEIHVGVVMTKNVSCCTPDVTISSVMASMTRGHFRHVPVVENNRLVGIISIGDVVKHRIDEISQEADEMRTYIASTLS